MVTHSEEYVAQTHVMVPMSGGTDGAWGACPELPVMLGEDTVRSCADLRMIMESQGGIVARLLRAIESYTGFRLVARDRRTGALAGVVEWVRDCSGRWIQWDEPVTGCAYGQHRPAVLLAA